MRPEKIEAYTDDKIEKELMVTVYLCLFPSNNLGPIVLSVSTVWHGGKQWPRQPLVGISQGLAANRKAKAIGRNQIGSANQKPVFQILH